jgi:penicillin-binding protein-related factor A (putative recombinase)|tara:strand:- start:6452 stop:7117 length:666 start_codon:yes stop_codon:yes gene_type:complete
MFKHSDKYKFEDLPRKVIDGKRYYVTPDGTKYPSVTTVTGQASAKSIAMWRKRVGEEEANKISKKATTAGTKVHKLCEDYVNNEQMLYEDVTPENLFMFKQIKPVLDIHLEEVWAVECPMYSDYLRVAGQCDCVGIFQGKPAIIDFKTASKRKRRSWITNYFMQESAYAVMFEEMTGKPIVSLVTIIAVANDEPQLFIEQRDDHIGYFQQWRQTYKERYDV